MCFLIACDNISPITHVPFHRGLFERNDPPQYRHGHVQIVVEKDCLRRQICLRKSTLSSAVPGGLPNPSGWLQICEVGSNASRNGAPENCLILTPPPHQPSERGVLACVCSPGITCFSISCEHFREAISAFLRILGTPGFCHPDSLQLF